MRELSCVIDLWNNHKEMTLYVIKSQLQSKHVTSDVNVNNYESDTEGFESDGNVESLNSAPLDYSKIIEEYYHTKYDSKNTGRRLIIMF